MKYVNCTLLLIILLGSATSGVRTQNRINELKLEVLEVRVNTIALSELSLCNVNDTKTAKLACFEKVLQTKLKETK